MAEPWLVTMAANGRGGRLSAEEGWTSGRGFSITSPKGVKASAVRGTASIMVLRFNPAIVIWVSIFEKPADGKISTIARGPRRYRLRYLEGSKRPSGWE
jgi:hypothetical protein